MRNITALAVCLLGSSAWASPKNELSVSAGVDSAYDDNVYNGRGPDFVNRINPSGHYRLLDHRVTFDTGYQLGYWTYAFGKANNSLNHYANMSVEGRVSRRLTMKVSDEFTRAEDPGFLKRAGVVAPQIGISYNIAEAQIAANLMHRWWMGVGYQFHLATFDRYTTEQALAFSPLYDGAEHRADLVNGIRVTRQDDLILGGRFQHFSAGPQSESISRWGLANTYSPTVGWQHRFLRPLLWTVDVGPLFYQALDGAANIPGAPQSSGTTWRLATRLRYLSPTWRASVSYSHDLLGATGAGTAIWADAVHAQVGYHFLERFDAHIGAGYFRNGRAVDQDMAFHGATADALMDVSIINNLRIGAYYTLRYQETGPGAGTPGGPLAAFTNVTRNIVGIRLMAVLGADARPPRREVRE